MDVGGKPPPPFCRFATVPLGSPVAFKPAGSPAPKFMVCPLMLVTYSSAVPFELWNMIKLPTVIGFFTPGMVKQPASSVTDAPVALIVPAQIGGPTGCATGEL